MNKIIIFVSILFLILSSITLTVSATLKRYESYETGGDFSWNFYTSYWHCQTFTVGNIGLNEDFYLKNISVYLKRSGTPVAGQVWVSLRAVDGSGVPTGSSLCHGSYTASSLPTVNYAWINFTMNITTKLCDASTKYAIILNNSGGTSSKSCITMVDTTSPTYTGGQMYYSSNSGFSWSGYSGYDCYFRVFGEKSTTDWNMSISNLSPVNNSNIYRTIDYNVISTKYNYSYTNFVNLSFLKNATEGKNSTSKVYFNNTLLYTGTWINGSRTINLLQNYGKSLINHVNYTVSINNSYQYIWHNYSYHFTFHINITNLPTINSTCDNTSLTVYNNTVNTTGKYETSYNSSTGNNIWLNFTGLGGGNITGYTEADLFIAGYITFILSITCFLMIRKRRKKNGL